MIIFNYGRVCSKLSPAQIGSLDISPSLSEPLLFLSKVYFLLFGYPDIASQRRYLIVEKLLHLKKDEKVLDAGCGNGIYLQEFGNKFNTTGFGIDVRKNRIESAKKINKYLGRSDTFLVSDLEKLNLGKEKFDKVICLEVLEHIKDDKGVLKKLARYIDKNGILVVSVPIKGTALSKEQEEDQNFKPKKYEHVRSGYTRKDITSLAKYAGLKVVSVEGYFYLVSRYMVKIQQYLFNKKLILLNVILSPLLLFVSGLDGILKTHPRGWIIVLKK